MICLQMKIDKKILPMTESVVATMYNGVVNGDMISGLVMVLENKKQ